MWPYIYTILCPIILYTLCVLIRAFFFARCVSTTRATRCHTVSDRCSAAEDVPMPHSPLMSRILVIIKVLMLMMTGVIIIIIIIMILMSSNIMIKIRSIALEAAFRILLRRLCREFMPSYTNEFTIYVSLRQADLNLCQCM